MAARPQFSLRMLFLVIAAAALFLGEATVFPAWIAWMVGMAVTLLLAPGLVAGIVYFRGPMQAFCMGALVFWLAARWAARMSFGALTLSPELPFSPAIFFQSKVDPSLVSFFALETVRYDYCILWSLMIVGGLVAAFVRWLAGGKLAS